MKLLSAAFISSLLILSASAHSQLAIYKMVGNNSSNSKTGYGTFVYWDFPMNEIGNRSLMIELLDLAFFPQKDENINSAIGYLSIKGGYKFIFSKESKTGFYAEPSAGYCRVVNSSGSPKDYGDGVAVAAEVGYNLEVGRKGNALVFGLKYESDMGSGGSKINAISLRFSYSFSWFKKRSNN